MENIEQLIEYQKHQIEQEERRLEELELIERSVKDEHDESLDITIKNVSDGYYEVYIVADKVTYSLQDILACTIVSDAEISPHDDGVVITATLDYKPFGVAQLIDYKSVRHED